MSAALVSTTQYGTVDLICSATDRFPKFRGVVRVDVDTQQAFHVYGDSVMPQIATNEYVALSARIPVLCVRLAE